MRWTPVLSRAVKQCEWVAGLLVRRSLLLRSNVFKVTNLNTFNWQPLSAQFQARNSMIFASKFFQDNHNASLSIHSKVIPGHVGETYHHDKSVASPDRSWSRFSPATMWLAHDALCMSVVHAEWNFSSLSFSLFDLLVGLYPAFVPSVVSLYFVPSFLRELFHQLWPREFHRLTTHGHKHEWVWLLHVRFWTLWIWILSYVFHVNKSGNFLLETFAQPWDNFVICGT